MLLKHHWIDLDTIRRLNDALNTLICNNHGYVLKCLYSASSVQILNGILKFSLSLVLRDFHQYFFFFLWKALAVARGGEGHLTLLAVLIIVMLYIPNDSMWIVFNQLCFFKTKHASSWSYSNDYKRYWHYIFTWVNLCLVPELIVRAVLWFFSCINMSRVSSKYVRGNVFFL